MKLTDLYPMLNEEADSNIPLDTRHTLPHAVIIPDMDLYYEYYKFVTAMASHPEVDVQYFQDQPMRDIPVAVAYTPQEYDMIVATAKRMGKHPKEIAFKKSQEPPGGNVTSPVMKFNMFESESDQMRLIMESIK